jgi:hypothetical protein
VVVKLAATVVSGAMSAALIKIAMVVIQRIMKLLGYFSGSQIAPAGVPNPAAGRGFDHRFCLVPFSFNGYDISRAPA